MATTKPTANGTIQRGVAGRAARSSARKTRKKRIDAIGIKTAAHSETK